MPNLDWRDCVDRAFGPLIKASGRSGLSLKKLKVLPPPEDERSAQFERFSSMKATDFRPLFLPNGGFFFPFFIGTTKSFAFSSFLDDADLNASLDAWLKENDAVVEFVDQSAFLFLSYYTSSFYSLRPEYQNRRASSEIVDAAVDNSYEGHSVDDLIGYYRPTYILSLPPDSVLTDADPYTIAAELLAMVPSLRSPIIDDDFSTRVHQLLSIPSVSPENIFLSLTATRWRYAFLELFKIIESVLYVPWVDDLLSELSIDARIKLAYSALRSRLDWREGKGRSIKRVFAALAATAELQRLEGLSRSFKDLDITQDERRAAIGQRVYKIRNQLVHPEDYTDRSVLNTSEDEFRILSIYLSEVATMIYEKYDGLLREA